MRSTIRVGLVALSLVTVFAVPPTSAQSSTLVVDDDAEECPEAGYGSIQAALEAASAGSTLAVCPGTYEEVVRVQTPDLSIEAEEGSLVRVDSSVAAQNHHPAVQLAADGVVVDGLDIERIVTDAGEAGSGHTKALGVSFDRSDGASPASITVRDAAVSLVDETGEEDFGNAVWVSDFNALGGDRAAIHAVFEDVRATNDASVYDPLDFGGAAASVVQVQADVSVEVSDSSLTESVRGLHVADGAPSVTVATTSITGNGIGILNDGETTVDASPNWWGSPLGPTHEDNPFAQTPATGDSVSGDVDYEPWCESPLCLAPVLSPPT